MNVTTIAIATVTATALLTSLLAVNARANEQAITQALTFHASFDTQLNADFSKGDRAAYFRKGKETIPAQLNDELKIVEGEGRFGGALWFPKKGASRPQYSSPGILNYNDTGWNTSVSVWLRLDPDKDLEPGYCDPVQIVGDDTKKGFIFLEWSKDETPRFFRYAMRPVFNIWNPDNLHWEKIPAAKRPMVQIERAPFSREKWTHAVFTVENVNGKANARKQQGQLYLNGQLQGKIENWDMTFAWDPTQVALVLGAYYVGYLDDLAVFNRPLTSEEVKHIFELKTGITELRPK